MERGDEAERRGRERGEERMNRDELAKIIEETAVESEGVKRLSCAAAFELTGKYPVTLKEIGESCDRLGVKIVRCQLGCF